ncbi:hypothetical protein TSOC_002189 [Tetrabaena socialis]|uniref:Uncharacterized protein n=1 Tax=Tetrabaena socialis TaxID=47790 RepID=A0A2J8AET2_9CHLO|nr:hypothetical protein TSOC_002189 [Tetrabaena socialis]|eukprot:PNH11027.1 hypothetical protein TSOC_002189 [Tetrabaena socialis]
MTTSLPKNVFSSLMARELGGRRPGTATGHSRRMYQSICPTSKAQQLDVPEVHISRFSPCGQYLRASAGRKLLQLLPPAAGASNALSSSPYLDPALYGYDDRVVSPYIRTRPSLEQPIAFRPRNRPDRAGGFRLEAGPYEAVVVRDRRFPRSVTHLAHPDAPFLLTVFSVFQQTSLNINYRG